LVLVSSGAALAALVLFFIFIFLSGGGAAVALLPYVRCRSVLFLPSPPVPTAKVPVS
jgi:hypothetical protein